MDTLWIVDNGGEIEKTIFNCSGICQSLIASRRNADMEFITARFYFKFVAYSRKLSGTIQLDNYHRRIRASSSYCEEESLSLSLSLSLLPLLFSHIHSSSLFFFSLPNDFQPPPLLPIPSSNRENIRIVCRAKVASSLKSIASSSIHAESNHVSR